MISDLPPLLVPAPPAAPRSVTPEQAADVFDDWEEDNCKWSTPTEQNANKRNKSQPTKSTQ